MGPTCDPPGTYWPQMGPMLTPWTLLSRECHLWRNIYWKWSIFTLSAKLYLNPTWQEHGIFRLLVMKCDFTLNGLFLIVCPVPLGTILQGFFDKMGVVTCWLQAAWRRHDTEMISAFLLGHLWWKTIGHGWILIASDRLCAAFLERPHSWSCDAWPRTKAAEGLVCIPGIFCFQHLKG